MRRRLLLVGVPLLSARRSRAASMLLGGVGPGTPLSVAIPGGIGTLTVGTATPNTVPLSWSAASGSPTPTYTVQYRISGSSVWQTAASGIAVTSYTVAGLIAGQTYQFNVFGTNSQGNGVGATLTTPTVSSGLSFIYWGTGGYTNTLTHGGGGGNLVAFVAAQGAIASCKVGYSPTQTDIPTILQTGSEFSSVCWGGYPAAAAPATAGTYYGWVIFYDASGNAILAVVATAGQTMQNGTQITPAVTVT